ncbi:hypothetical protein BDZ91DRAFT_767078 [Kalaharituber pfeilii]|nr:hypothetical protein BDZ91DRAFT_767078 [Kalaharituber pfeilii]
MLAFICIAIATGQASRGQWRRGTQSGVLYVTTGVMLSIQTRIRSPARGAGVVIEPTYSTTAGAKYSYRVETVAIANAIVIAAQGAYGGRWLVGSIDVGCAQWGVDVGNRYECHACAGWGVAERIIHIAWMCNIMSMPWTSLWFALQRRARKRERGWRAKRTVDGSSEQANPS